MRKIIRLFNTTGKFAVKTFPDATPAGHLRKMKEEADEAIEDPSDIMEYADCLLALFGAVYKAGFTMNDLFIAGNDKLKINKEREWVKQPDGLYQHKEPLSSAGGFRIDIIPMPLMDKGVGKLLVHPEDARLISK